MLPRLLVYPSVFALGLACASCTLDTAGQGAFDGTSLQDASTDGPAGPDATEADAADGPADAWAEGDSAHETGDGADDATSEDGGCVPETDAAFCTRHHKDCGEYTEDDNCGASRTTDCGSCPTGTSCGGSGTPNACDWWWECAWTTRRPIAVHANAAIPRNYSVPIQLDHAALVAAGRALPSGDDVRIVAWDGFAWTEVDRVLDPDSSWNAGNTTIWFGTRAQMAAGEQAQYYLFSGNPTPPPPPASERAVFAFADFFERPDATDPGYDWIFAEDPGTDVAVRSGALWMDAADQNNRPVADAPFDAISDGLEWRMGFDWARTGEEGWYRLHLQLGDSGLMENPPSATDYFSNVGVGPSLLWSGVNNGMTSNEGLGHEVAGAVTQVAQISGKHRLRSVVSFATKTYTIEVDGVAAASDVPFSSSLSSVDRLRLMTWQLNSANFGRRAFDYVIIRRMALPEPSVTLGAFQDGSCL